MHNSELRKNSPQRPTVLKDEVNSAVDGALLLLAPTTVDASRYTRGLKTPSFLVDLFEPVCTACRQQIGPVKFEPHRARVC